ncbi:Fur family transcriptional regulator [Thermoflavimicrobium dichotomicum]|uniref:Fur family transcriptional regulator, zinc uptake regulator n=1 Tax=Thermoflavimicrobium dichotomicum TaxID=46223 RepID=A0A1I3KJK1_9BACL|nr:Fur family transcriptional regulator [Thermoflavimicrobium dichotomicum]SFI72584.1 Fur family transcriptional regulator, zinc uptake regulator [Thermoflavimicrobium dichotomicum]
MDLKEALAILKKNGYKYTDKRELMLHIFLKEGRYLTAKEVLDHMQQDYPGLSFDTIYRNLSLFERLGIIEGTEWDGERRYRIHCKSDHHHHLICTECGKTKTLHVCPMNAILGKPQDFEITGHKFEIYGRCAECGESGKHAQV